MTLVFVLTSTGRDVHADMAYVAMSSARIFNPDIRIAVVCDAPSAEAVRGSGHPVLGLGDEWIAAPVPEGSAAVRNRWVKTTLPHHVEGPFLYLDNDVLVRGSLMELSSTGADLAAVPNHSGSGSPAEMPGTERAVFDQLRWPLPDQFYVNGGCLFCKGTAPGRAFFDAWHQSWHQSVTVTGRHFDQAALNHALGRTPLHFEWLSGVYNAQVNARPSSARKALVWHFYSSDAFAAPRTVFDRLVTGFTRTGVLDSATLRRACVQPLPWLSGNPISWYAIRRMTARSDLLNTDRWERLWLAGEYRQALVDLFGRLRWRMGRRFQSVQSRFIGR